MRICIFIIMICNIIVTWSTYQYLIGEKVNDVIFLTAVLTGFIHCIRIIELIELRKQLRYV